MKNAFRSLILLLMLSLASCKSLQRNVRPNNSSGPIVEHELLKVQKKSKSKADKNQRHKDKERADDAAPTKGEEKELIDFINDWYGTPHKMGGTSKKGVDCSGFVIVAYREVFDKEFKGRRAEDIFAEVQIVKWEDLAYGDLVFFQVNGRRIDHVGIYVGEGNFAHSSSSRGVMISAINNSYWAKRYFKAGRF